MARLVCERMWSNYSLLVFSSSEGLPFENMSAMPGVGPWGVRVKSAAYILGEVKVNVSGLLVLLLEEDEDIR